MANIKKSFFVSLFRRMSPRSEQAREKTIAELEEKVRRLTAQAESAELKSRWLEVIFSSMFEGVVALDSKLTIIMVNPRLCSLFGFDKDARVNGMPLLSFSRSAELEEAARQVLSSGQPQELTIRRYTPGNEQHFRVFAAPLEESRGVAIVLGDISRLVKLEQVRKDFAANVSHELRTPIQVVKGFTETILDSPLDDKEEIRRFVGIIKKSVHLMETMTNDLLTLVSLEDGDSSRPSMEETLVTPLIAEAAGMVEIAAEKKEITIKAVCDPDLNAKLYGPFIVQALINLLDNAIHYSPCGSHIKVKACIEIIDSAASAAVPSGAKRQLVIEVKDQGIGIPAEHIGRIFERFYRVDRSRSRTDGGTGLGLAIVRHIALLHKGSAEAESHAGEGSVFRLRLPC